MAKWNFQSGEPDGRLYIELDNGFTFVVYTDAIDALVKRLQDHMASEGDGQPFWLDVYTGESGLL